MNKLKLIIAIFGISLIMASCDDPASFGPLDNSGEITQPINYGNGVYYFCCTERKFARSLSSFLSDSSKHIKAIAGDGKGYNGADQGYFVVIGK